MLTRSRLAGLHSEQGGLASAEYILAIPVFLVMLLLIMDIGKHRTALLHTIVASRNAAWSQATGGQCLHLDTLPELIDPDSTIVPLGCSDNPEAALGSEFWSGIDRAGGQRLTGAVSNVEGPSSIEAQAMLRYDTYDWPEWTFQPRTYDYTMVSMTPFMHTEDELRVGYDKEMEQRFRQGTGRLMQMFPNVFPGARR